MSDVLQILMPAELTQDDLLHTGQGLHAGQAGQSIVADIHDGQVWPETQQAPSTKNYRLQCRAAQIQHRHLVASRSEMGQPVQLKHAVQAFDLVSVHGELAQVGQTSKVWR